MTSVLLLGPAATVGTAVILFATTRFERLIASNEIDRPVSKSSHV